MPTAQARQVGPEHAHARQIGLEHAQARQVGLVLVEGLPKSANHNTVPHFSTKVVQVYFLLQIRIFYIFFVCLFGRRCRSPRIIVGVNEFEPGVKTLLVLK